MRYTVGDIRKAGIECKWSRTRTGAPIIVGKTDTVGRDGKPIWAYIDGEMWDDAKRQGLKAAFEAHTALIGFFSIPV